jgi:hypothetical protein
LASIKQGHNGESFAFYIVVDAEWEALRQGTVVAIYNLVDAAEVGQRLNVRHQARDKISPKAL